MSFFRPFFSYISPQNSLKAMFSVKLKLSRHTNTSLMMNKLNRVQLFYKICIKIVTIVVAISIKSHFQQGLPWLD